jgi:hypothetical protein
MRTSDKNMINFIMICLLCVQFNACAFDVVHIKQIPLEMHSSATTNQSFKLIEEVKIKLGTGYSRTLKKGTTWSQVGSVSYGDIFKTSDQILTVEGSNIYEAYIVVKDKNLIGFYLPVDQTYSPLKAPKELIIQIP